MNPRLRQTIRRLREEVRVARRDAEFQRKIADTLATQLGRARQQMARDDELRQTLERLGDLVGWRTAP